MLVANSNSSVNSAIVADYASSYGISSKNQVIAEWNMNAYSDIKSYGVIDTDLNIRIQEGVDSVPIKIADSSASYTLITNQERRKYSDLGNVFEPNRPSLDILNYVANRFTSSIIYDVSSIRVNRLSTSNPRFYPYSENIKGFNWSSFRIKLSSDKSDIQYTGVSDYNGNIKDADVYVNYSASFYANKIVIKTQYQYGFPSDFDIYITDDITSSSNWGASPIYSYKSSSANSTLNDGELTLFYNYSSQTWSTASSSNTLVTDLDYTSNQFVKIQGIRLKVNKMYSPTIYSKRNGNLTGMYLQLVEISPRLLTDITDYVKSFSINSEISNSQFGMPVGGLINSTGNIELSNMTKYFSNSSDKSIIKNYMKPNVKFTMYQVVDKTVSGSATQSLIPLKTMYALRWEEDSEFTTSIELEDYMKFFKEKAAPDILIANTSGVPSSVAILHLLDNIGFGKYSFIKTSDTNDYEDTILQYFYSRKENTVAQTLEELAMSAQLSMFFDAQNNFVVMTKERVSTSLPSSSISWWFAGDPEKTTPSDPEYTSLTSGSYISNIKSFNKTVSPPVTDARISYNGLGIQKQPFDLVSNPELRDILDNLQLDAAPILSRNLRYATTNLWSSNNDTENILLSGTLLSDIPGDVLSEMKNLSASPVISYGKNEYEAIRNYYFSKNAADRKYLTIELDPSSMETFVANKSYNGTLMIDEEFVSFKGILFNIKPYRGTATSSILFNERERISLRSIATDISPVALVLYLDFDLKDQASSVVFNASGTFNYKLNYHGRGVTTFKSSEIQKHDGILSSSALSNWSYFGTRIMTPTQFSISGSAYGTIVSSPGLINNTITDTSLKSFPGFLRLRGSMFDNTTASGIFSSTGSNNPETIKFNYKIDTDISGIYQETSSVISVLATRMRILQYTKPPKDIVTVNRDIQDLSGMGGIFFGLRDEGTSSAIGYFVELTAAGQTNAEQIESNEIENLRFYKISSSSTASGVMTGVQLLGKAAVAAATTSQATKDVKAVTEEGSFTAISDIRIIINEDSVDIYWEDQKVISYQRNGIRKEICNNYSKKYKIGLFSRGNTISLFEYFLAASENGQVVSKIFDNNIDLISAAERGSITKSVKGIISQQNIKYIYDDFGKTVKELKYFNVRFEPPTIKADLLDFGIKTSKYYIPSFYSNSFGAKFWIMNTSNDIIKIGEDSSVPIYIAGFALTRSNNEDSYVEMQDFLDAQQNKFNIDINSNEFSKITSSIERNKSFYGENSLSLNTEYIFTYQQSYDLLSWLVKNYTKEKITIDMDVYANPLLELGDIVRVFYKEKGFTQSKVGEKSFVISKINYSVSSDGPNMVVQVRECF